MVAIKDYEREGMLSHYFFTEFSSLQLSYSVIFSKIGDCALKRLKV